MRHTTAKLRTWINDTVELGMNPIPPLREIYPHWQIERYPYEVSKNDLTDNQEAVTVKRGNATSTIILIIH